MKQVSMTAAAFTSFDQFHAWPTGLFPAWHPCSYWLPKADYTGTIEWRSITTVATGLSANDMHVVHSLDIKPFPTDNLHLGG